MFTLRQVSNFIIQLQKIFEFFFAVNLWDSDPVFKFYTESSFIWSVCLKGSKLRRRGIRKHKPNFDLSRTFFPKFSS